MKKLVYLILLCLLSSASDFAMENNDRGWGPYGEWDLDNPCLYHTRFSNQVGQAPKLSYKELLVAAKDRSLSNKEQVVKDWQLIDKVISLFSKPLWNHLGIDGYLELPVVERLNFTDEEFIEYRSAITRLNELFSQKLSYGLLGLQETEIAKRERNDRFNPLMFELDFALTILLVNSRKYIGSLT